MIAKGDVASHLKQEYKKTHMGKGENNMSKLKNKKRLATTFVALMLVFVLGAAYALGTGVLTFTGTVHIVPSLSVVWGEEGVAASVTIVQDDAIVTDDPLTAGYETPSIEGHGTETLTFTAAFGAADDEIVIAGTLNNIGAIDALLNPAWSVEAATAINAALDTAAGHVGLFAVEVEGFVFDSLAPPGLPADPVGIAGSTIDAGDDLRFELVIRLTDFCDRWAFTYNIAAPPTIDNTAAPADGTVSGRGDIGATFTITLGYSAA